MLYYLYKKMNTIYNKTCQVLIKILHYERPKM